MTHPIVKKHMTHRKQVINHFSTEFQEKMKAIKYMLHKNMY